jgi:hypothetical protein
MLCPGVFCAAVAIAGGGRTEPVRVAVDAEDAAAHMHAWGTSSHQVGCTPAAPAFVCCVCGARAMLGCPGVAVHYAPGSPEAYLSTLDSPHTSQCFQRISALASRASTFFLRSAAARQLLTAPVDKSQGGVAAAAGAPGGGGLGGGNSSEGGSGSAGLDALECLLLWLSTYSDLFSRPCSATGKLLCWEPASAVPLPPVVRPFK